MNLDMLSSSARAGADRILGRDGGAPSGQKPGAAVLDLRFHRIEDPLREQAAALGKNWDDPEIKKAIKRLRKRGDEGVGQTPDGHFTLDGRTCCYDLVSSLVHGEKVIPEGDTEPKGQAPGLRWRCTCRALWEARYEVVS